MALPCAMILAGGAGLRMGGHKPFHVYENKPLIVSVIDALRPQAGRLFLNAREESDALNALGQPLCFDDEAVAGLGPLSGIHTALKTGAAIGEDVVITAPCDMPHLPHDMVTQLVARMDDQTDIVHFSGARDYPLCALWHTRLLPHLESALLAARKHGGLAVMGYLKTVRTAKIRANNDAAFININQPLTGAPEA
ncbi:MAG: molybdenum cofactor guanylyltransferase [Asticcacaulis sp.]